MGKKHRIDNSTLNDYDYSPRFKKSDDVEPHAATIRCWSRSNIRNRIKSLKSKQTINQTFSIISTYKNWKSFVSTQKSHQKSLAMKPL